MLTAKLLFKCLEREGVEIIFGYPGGALLPIYDAFRDSSIEHILVRNEQSAPHYASGYARETGKVGVCLATSGPGATNLITGIASAYLDSIPVVAITGQVNRELIGTDAFQEADIFGATLPFVKHSYLVKNPEALPKIIKEAFFIASTGRPGPVLIDIPRDVQLEIVKRPKYSDEVAIRGYKPTYEGHTGQIRRAIRKIKASNRPLIYAGGGVVSSHGEAALLKLAETIGAPVVTSFMGIGAFPQNHPLYAGIWGSHGYAYTNRIVEAADLALCIGARMSNRGTSTAVLNEKEMIHIDIDPAEIGKNVNDTNIPIVGDAKIVVAELLEKGIETDTRKWLEEVRRIKADNPVCLDDYPGMAGVNPKKIFAWLSGQVPEDTTLVADVGLNQVWAALHFQVRNDRCYMTSGGLGTMGYAIPAASGVAFATRKAPKTVIGVCGDGSFQMAVGELGVIAEYRLPVKLILLNNHKLGMVRQQQHDNYGKNHYSGTDIDFNVNFMQLAQAYNIQGYHAETQEEAEAAILNALKQPGPALVECVVSEDYLKF